MKIGLLSFADCDNYGDKYFAPICNEHLAKLLPEAQFIHITPTGATIDGELYSAYDPYLLDTRVDAILLVGGEVVHTEDHLFLDIYARQGLVSSLPHPTDLVFSSPYLNVPYKAWISTGISSSITSPDSAGRLADIIPRLNRIMLRGILAKDNLDALTGRNLYAEVVPDLGWLIPYHGRNQPSEPDEFLTASPNITGFDWQQPYLVFQTIPAAVNGIAKLTDIAATLLKIQNQTGLQVVLLPITHYTGDSQLLAELNEVSGNSFVLMPDRMRRNDVANILLHAAISITSSLHGAITCLAAGIPAGVIHPGETKFYDLFGMQQRLHFFRREWSNLYELAMDLSQEPRELLLEYARGQQSRLGSMFRQIADEIKRSQTTPGNFPYEKQFDDTVRSFRRNEWVHAANLNQILHEELRAKALNEQLEMEKFELLIGKIIGKKLLTEIVSEQVQNTTTFINSVEASFNETYLLKRQELEAAYQSIIEQQKFEIDTLNDEALKAKKVQQSLTSQIQQWKGQFEALQDTRTVRLMRNLKIVTNTLHQVAKEPFEEVIQGYLEPPQLEKLNSLYVTVVGWAASSQGHIKTVGVFLEGTGLGEAYYGLERSEVLLKRPLQLERHCGFAGRFELDARRYSSGSNILRVSIVDSKGNTRQFSSTVELKPELLGFTSQVQILPASSKLISTQESAKVPKRKTTPSFSVYERSRSLAQIQEVKLFVAGSGNIFMQDIARIFQYGFAKNGLLAEILIDQLPEVSAGLNCLQLVIAPHEFYPLFLEKELGQAAIKQITQAVYLLNVEQPDSQWFNLTHKIAEHAAGIWDINQQGVAEFGRRGLTAAYTPIGYAPFLEATIKNPQAAAQPIDVTFMGSSSERRENLLAGYSDFLNRYNCHMVLSRLDNPRLNTTPGYVDEEARARLLKQSKILLNLHSSSNSYFEWHRALVAMANRCLFVTEPCDGFSPLVEGKHFVLAEIPAIPGQCQYYLENELARLEIVEAAYQFVTTDLDASVLCQAWLSKII